jgi:uncharacterized membrane protein (Fun14 family)
VFETGIPTQISYGFITGYCSGFAAKKIGKLAAGAFGVAFMGLQTLAYFGYIQIDHKQIKKDIMGGYLDLNHDGIVDGEDVSLLYKKLMKILEFNLPAGSGFGAGFISGVKTG